MGPPEDNPNERTLYLYRAQNDEEYPLENVDVADLPGVLWYLHHEVAYSCPRKNNINRIMRMKVTVLRTPERQKTQWMFGEFVAFDSGQCGTDCYDKLKARDFAVGCQLGKYGSIATHWYSLPGPCPVKPFKDQDEECREKYPTSTCGCDEPFGYHGDGHHCTYRLERAGEVRINDLVGIKDQAEYCRNGGKEYDWDVKHGLNGVTFWDGYENDTAIMLRMEAVKNAFKKRYPHMPVELDGNPDCSAHPPTAKPKVVFTPGINADPNAQTAVEAAGLGLI